MEPGQRMEESIVPACPQGLSINKTDFLKQDFSVDNFFIEVIINNSLSEERLVISPANLLNLHHSLIIMPFMSGEC